MTATQGYPAKSAAEVVPVVTAAKGTPAFWAAWASMKLSPQ